MDRRQTLPRVWLVTDERLEERLFEAIGRLPRQAGILFRHYSLREPERRALFEGVRERAQADGHMLLLAGPAMLARAWGADGWHGWDEGRGLRSVSVHNVAEMRRAQSGGAGILFVSPVFSTRSHPGAPSLGPRGFAALAARSRLPVIALGGVTRARVPLVRRLGAYGWGGIDAWLA